MRQKFGGHERDSETSLYFAQARYFSSSEGRFTSIDPYNIIMETHYNPNEKEARSQFLRYLSNPQRWNRYAFTLNNPLLYTDPTGEDVTIYYRPPRKGEKDFGHILIYVRNDETGESAYFDYYPDQDMTVVSNVNQARIDAHASLTIETTAAQEQAILNGVKELSNSAPNYDANWQSFLKGCESTCVTTSSNLLSRGGININEKSPAAFWSAAYQRYSDAAFKFEKSPLSYFRDRGSRLNPHHPGVLGHNPSIGQEYGRDPSGQGRRWDPSALNANTKTIFKDRQIQRVERFQ